jgi:integrase
MASGDKRKNKYKYKVARTIHHGRYNEKKGIYESSYRKYFYGSSKKEVEKKYAAFLAEISQNNGADSGVKATVGEKADYYVYEVLRHDPRLAEQSRQKLTDVYESKFRKSSIATMPLASVRSHDLQRYYNTLDITMPLLKILHTVVKRIFRHLANEGYCKDITQTIVLPKKIENPRNTSGEIVVWTDEELSKIMNGLGNRRYRLLILLAIHTGCRISELLGLKYSDFEPNESGDVILFVERQVIRNEIVKEDGGKSRVPTLTDKLKSKNSYRSIPVPKWLTAEITRHKKWHLTEMKKYSYKTELFFTSKKGGLYFENSVANMLKVFYRQVGVPYRSFHTYRHSFATLLSRNGVPIQTTSALLGHASIEDTAKYYINISDDEKRSAVESIGIVGFKNGHAFASK